MDASLLLQNQAVVTFMVSATRYCALVEPESTPSWTMETMRECRVALAGIYYSALSLPSIPTSIQFVNDELEHYVTEDSYLRVQQRLERLFGIEDRFLNAQQEEQKYSDLPVSVSLSELMADIYQAVADPLWDIRHNGTTTLVETIGEVVYSFEYEWGPSALIALKQLHDLTINPNFDLLSSEDSIGNNEEVGV